MKGKMHGLLAFKRSLTFTELMKKQCGGAHIVSALETLWQEN